MNEIVKEHIISGLQTFAATFLTVIATTLSSGVEWTGAFWGAVLLAAIRAGIKEVVARTFPVSLGGRK